MSKFHLAWLWFKRTFQVGWFRTLVGDKCNSYFTDKDCPNKATVSEYHRSQFGHKVQFQFCDQCYAAYNEWQKSDFGSMFMPSKRTFEKLK